ncbi:hypothetical protein CMV30_15805 [Nibricoccus aquaticus]|uniref:Protein kinase domain-containing protein n=1 Tax=Nibricoccus aquaticus TaxID=2576891 RepID=A0A290Q9U6_9BACT|nr:protein kinase family protein [Nibricoccus aquaticus]ATC65294.1 hypothetical protein CMV30_15805 [Nibricoccus aquaticus]
MLPETDDSGGLAPPSVPVDSAEASPASPTSGSPIASGQRWHAYQIGDAIHCDAGWAFHAVNVGALEDVCIFVRPIDEGRAARAEAWSKLQNGKYPGLIEVFDAVEENGFRFETTQVPPATTMREWANTHQASLDDVEALVKQLAAAVQAMHLVGVVHCNLNLDTIHLVAADAGLKVLIGGLDTATLYDQSGLIPLPVNPLYAPPEAAGLTKHRAGAGLRAWDWWSLGRIMQELVIGQPVLGLVLDRDVSKMTHELRARAEELLLERDSAGPKAGAVEKMPPISDDLASLLRGLLSSCRDGRWGWREVQCWLKRETLPDRYELTRNDRLFVWRDRAFTVAEAAAFFRTEEHWAAGVDQLFDVKNPASFIAFASREQELSGVREQLDALRDFVQLPAWRECPVEVVRTVIAAASWLQIGGEREPLLLRGKRVDSALLRALLKSEPLAEGLALVRALIAPPFVQLIAARDPETARLLTVVGTSTTETMATAEKNEWLTVSDPAAVARLLSSVLEGETELVRHREELKKRFALSRDPQLEAIFKAPKAKHRELILLVFAAGDPERTGFVTHLDWSRERYMVLRERGERLAAKLFWLRLGQLMQTGPLVFLRWPWVIGVWAGLAAIVAVLAPPPLGLVVGVALALVLFGLRVLVCASQRGCVRRYAHDPQEIWTMRSRADRCAKEAEAALPGDPVRKPGMVAAELASINREIVGLALDPAPEAVRAPSELRAGWLGSGLGWLLAVGALGWTGWSHMPQAETAPEGSELANQLPGVAGDPARPVGKPKTVLTSEEQFFSDPRSVYVSWNFEEPDEAPALPVRGYAKPTPEQVATALIDGQKLLAPYAPQTAQGVIAIPVATSDEPGVMLYDVKRRMLLERRIFKLEQLPATDRSWHELNRRKILYLGEPPELSLEMWADESAARPSPAAEPARAERPVATP